MTKNCRRMNHHLKTDSRLRKKGESALRLLADPVLDMGLNVPVGGTATLPVNTPQTASGSISLNAATVQADVLFQVGVLDSNGDPVCFVEPPNVQVNDATQTWSVVFQTPTTADDFTFVIQATYCPPDSLNISIFENTGSFTTV
jgi:hypothetical protein